MAELKSQFETVRLKLPIRDEDLADLKIATIVYLDGVIYTGREGVYKRVVEEGMAIPIDLPAVSNVNFHCSPAAAIEADGSYNVGGVTATASFRFAKWMAAWFKLSGARIIIGKGGMSEEHYKELFVPARAIYLTTVGYGTGALLGRGTGRKNWAMPRQCGYSKSKISAPSSSKAISRATVSSRNRTNSSLATLQNYTKA